VKALPLRTFWLMHNNIDRIEAQRDMRTLSIGVAAQSTNEAAQEVRSRLEIERGEVVVVDEQQARAAETLDAEGLDELRTLSD
jgi:hypothetical protein